MVKVRPVHHNETPTSCNLCGRPFRAAREMDDGTIVYYWCDMCDVPDHDKRK